MVYTIAHWSALTNRYVMNDDVRQQVFWMQQWDDPELFQDDLLARYARNYVPWGVQAVYFVAAPFMNPLQFTKVLAGILFVVTAGFLFGLGLETRDELTAVFVVIAFFFFTSFLRKISGGLSQSFAFPLLTAYLFFLAGRNVRAAGVVLLLESVFNPYIFLLCLATHTIFLFLNYFPGLARRLCGFSEGEPVDLVALVKANLPVLVGVFLMALKYVFLKPTEFGDTVSWAQMVGKIEYGPAGRYEMIPGPSFLAEVLRPVTLAFPVDERNAALGWIGLFLITVLTAFALRYSKRAVNLSGFKVFAYLLPASLALYGLADALLLKLFVPRRYLEFSLNIFYCTLLGVGVVAALDAWGWKKKVFPVAVSLLVLLGAVRLHNVGIYDYSADAPLYDFLETTPKTSLVAGPPDIMDNTLTFARRKAFVTYELSHTWMDRYWGIIKQRTEDFLKAYYAQDPEEIRAFAQGNGVDYLVVREADFSRDRLKTGLMLFEPFDGSVRSLVGSRSQFAALDRHAFPVVYEHGGIRVLRLSLHRN